MTLLPVLLSTVLAASDEPSRIASDEPSRIVIPDELFLEFQAPEATEPSAADPEDAGVDRAARALNVAPVTIADDIEFYGHVERVEAGGIIVLGHRTDTRFATFRGGAREAVVPGALVRVAGSGRGDGSVEASVVELVIGRDPALWSQLVPELRKFKDEYWKKAKRYDDPALDLYLRAILDRLTPAYLTGSEHQFSIAVVEDPTLNAFALPDGTLVVHTGIIARMDNEAQLASVLAHEMAHVTQHHTLRAMQRQTEHKIVGWGALLAAVALGVAGKGDAAQGVQLMSSAWLAGYSRAHEDEADEVGLRYLYLAGYDVREAPEVWKTFQLLYGSGSKLDNFFYGSHSTASDREFHLSHEVWKSYEPAGQLGGRVAADSFARRTAAAVRHNAMLDLEGGNLAAAEWGLARSLSVVPDDALSLVALGRVLRARGGSDALDHARESFERALELDPCCAPAYRELGFALSALGRVEEARAAFTRYLELEPSAPDAEKVRKAM